MAIADLINQFGLDRSYDELFAGAEGSRYPQGLVGQQLTALFGEGPQVPALFNAFALEGERLINQQAASTLRAGAEGLSSGRAETERSLTAGLQSAGLNPLVARQILAESYEPFGAQVGQLEAGVEGQRLDDLFNLSRSLTDATARSFDTERQLGLQAYLASRARRAARRGAQDAFRIGGLQAFLSASTAPLGALGGAG